MGRRYYINPTTRQRVYLPDYLTPIDTTLTESGQAADAEATGEALSAKVSYTDKLSQITGTMSDAEKNSR